MPARIESIDAQGGVSEITFNLGGEQPATLFARVVTEDYLPKCKCLKKTD